MKTPYPIKFPFTRERTGRRCGPRYRRVVDKAGLEGARLCAANMIACAMLHRDEATPLWAAPERVALHRRITRLGMRLDALWARVFAGQIDQDDPRIDAAGAERHQLVIQYCGQHAA